MKKMRNVTALALIAALTLHGIPAYMQENQSTEDLIVGEEVAGEQAAGDPEGAGEIIEAEANDSGVYAVTITKDNLVYDEELAERIPEIVTAEEAEGEMSRGDLDFWDDGEDEYAEEFELIDEDEADYDDLSIWEDGWDESNDETVGEAQGVDWDEVWDQDGVIGEAQGYDWDENLAQDEAIGEDGWFIEDAFQDEYEGVTEAELTEFNDNDLFAGYEESETDQAGEEDGETQPEATEAITEETTESGTDTMEKTTESGTQTMEETTESGTEIMEKTTETEPETTTEDTEFVTEDLDEEIEEETDFLTEGLDEEIEEETDSLAESLEEIIEGETETETETEDIGWSLADVREEDIRVCYNLTGATDNRGQPVNVTQEVGITSFTNRDGTVELSFEDPTARQLSARTYTIRFENSSAYVIVDTYPVGNGFVPDAVDYEAERAADGEGLDINEDVALPEGTYIEDGQLYVTDEAPALVQDVLLTSGIAEEEMSRSVGNEPEPADEDKIIEELLDEYGMNEPEPADPQSNANGDNNGNGSNTGGTSNATLEYLQQYNARVKMFNNFDAVADYTTEILGYVDPTAGQVASYANDAYNIFKGVYLGNAQAVLKGSMGVLKKFGLFKQNPGVTNEMLLEELKNVRVDIQNVMSEVQNVGLEVVNLHCLTSEMNRSVKIVEQELYSQGVEAFDNALIAMEADAEVLQRMFAQGAIVADEMGLYVPVNDCTAQEEFDFNTQLVEIIIGEEQKGGAAAQPFRDFKSYVEDLRTNFTLVAGAVAKPEATNPILKYDKYWNTYFNFETQGYALRQAYRSNIAYQLTRAFSLLEIYYNIFDPRTASTQDTHYTNYAKAMDALAAMPAGQSPEDIDRSADGLNGNRKFRVYCPTFNCDITELSIVHNLVATGKVLDEQMNEFINRLHGRNLEQELKLAGLWGNGRYNEWYLESWGIGYDGDKLLWDGEKIGGTYNNYDSRRNYYCSGHGIGFNGTSKEDGEVVTDIIDINGILHKEVVTNPNWYVYVTSVFDMPPEMEYTINVPYIHFTMEPHVG